MSVLVITPEKQAEIAAAIERARANVVPWSVGEHIAVSTPDHKLDLKDRRNPEIRRPPSVRVVFDGSGIEAAFSFEEQPAGLLRHLSVSTHTGRKLPNPVMLAAVAKEFGIDFDISGRGDPLCGRPGRIWQEEYEPGRYAINIAVLEVASSGPVTKQ